MHEQYRGQDQVYTATNGAGMEISHIGQAVIKTPHKNLEINEILHVPNASKTLLSVNRIALDNNVFSRISPVLLFDQGSGHEEGSS